jgi:hypothetical protein
MKFINIFIGLMFMMSIIPLGMCGDPCFYKPYQNMMDYYLTYENRLYRYTIYEGCDNNICHNKCIVVDYFNKNNPIPLSIRPALEEMLTQIAHDSRRICTFMHLNFEYPGKLPY